MQLHFYRDVADSLEHTTEWFSSLFTNSREVVGFCQLLLDRLMWCWSDDSTDTVADRGVCVYSFQFLFYVFFFAEHMQKACEI